MAIYSGFSHKKMVIFCSYVSLPEGRMCRNTESVQNHRDMSWYIVMVPAVICRVSRISTDLFQLKSAKLEHGRLHFMLVKFAKFALW